MYWIIIGIMESPEGIKQFDPFEILGVDHDATDK
jgi:preprotein translocase subunit Sec63